MANVYFQTDNCVFADWADSETPIVESVFQLLPDEIAAKRKTFPKPQADALMSFLRSRGIDVVEVIEDPAEHARFEVWRQKLRNPPTVITRDRLASMFEEIGIELRDLQRAAIFRLLNTFFGLLAAGCGAGKTLVFLSIVQILKKLNGGNVFAVVACPSACASEYRKELERFRGFFDLTLEEVITPNSRAAIRKIADSTADIIVISVDSAHALVPVIRERLQAFSGERILKIDEGHSIKSVESRRSRAIQQVAPFFDRVIISTATPIPKSPSDIRGYIATVGFPQPVEAYLNGIPPQDFAVLRNVAFVSDETDIPFGELRSEQIDFDDFDDLNGAIIAEVNAELAAGNKVAIFCNTNRALVGVHSMFPGVGRTVLSGSYAVDDCADEHLTSGRSVELQRKAIDQFNTDPRCMLLIANYKVGSTGLNLQYSKARMAVFYEITTSGADLFQSKYRIRRPMVFPRDGFRYLFAVPNDADARRRTLRQFAKLTQQSLMLERLKQASRGVQ